MLQEYRYIGISFLLQGLLDPKQTVQGLFVHTLYVYIEARLVNLTTHTLHRHVHYLICILDQIKSQNVLHNKCKRPK